MIDLKERRMIELDPDLAKSYLNYNTYELQRPERPLHTKELAETMENGLFRFGEVGFCSLNGASDLMVNGQHVSNAVILSGITVPCMLEKFTVDNWLEFSKLYRQFDGFLVRTFRDWVKAEKGALKLPWPIWLCSLVVAAAVLDKRHKLGYSLKGYTKILTPMTGDHTRTKGEFSISKKQRVELLGKYLKEGEFLFKLLVLGTPTEAKKEQVVHMIRAPVVFAMIETWRISESDANIFWKRVRDGEFLERAMPEMQLREFLMRSTLTQTRSHRRPVSGHEMIARIHSAWNAFRTGNATKLAYYSERPFPLLK